MSSIINEYLIKMSRNYHVNLGFLMSNMNFAFSAALAGQPILFSGTGMTALQFLIQCSFILYL